MQFTFDMADVATKQPLAMQTSKGTLYQKDPAEIQYLVRSGPVSAVAKKYLLQSGVPVSDFKCKG